MGMRCFKIQTDYKLKEILLEFCRYRRFQLSKDNTVLVYDSNNTPRLQSPTPYDYIEPINNEPIEFLTDQIIGLELNSMGEIFLNQLNEQGASKKSWRIGRAI